MMDRAEIALAAAHPEIWFYIFHAFFYLVKNWTSASDLRVLHCVCVWPWAVLMPAKKSWMKRALRSYNKHKISFFHFQICGLTSPRDIYPVYSDSTHCDLQTDWKNQLWEILESSGITWRSAVSHSPFLTSCAPIEPGSAYWIKPDGTRITCAFFSSSFNSIEFFFFF